MTAIAFDTLKAATRLKAAGFDEKQAHELVATFAESMGENVATKDDLALMKGDLKAEFDSLRKDTKAEIDGLRKDTKAEFDSLRKDTKAEIDGLRKDTKAEIDLLRKDMVAGDGAIRKDMAAGFQNLEQRMTIKLGSLIVAAVGFLAVLDRLFPAG